MSKSNGLDLVNIYFQFFFGMHSYCIVIQIPWNSMGLIVIQIPSENPGVREEHEWFYSTHFANPCITIYYNIIQLQWCKVKG